MISTEAEFYDLKLVSTIDEELALHRLRMKFFIGIVVEDEEEDKKEELKPEPKAFDSILFRIVAPKKYEI